MASSGVRGVVAVVVLAFGAADAFAFTELGGTFVANMNGDLVFVGLPSRPAYATAALGAGLALVAWSAAAFAGFRITRGGNGRALFAAAVVVQVAITVGWALLPLPVPAPTCFVVVALSAGVMAAQAVLTKRLLGELGSSTTSVTGTLTDLLQSLADGDPRVRLPRLLVVLAIPLGVLVAVAVDRLAPALEPAVTALSLAAAAAAAWPDRSGTGARAGA